MNNTDNPDPGNASRLPPNPRDARRPDGEVVRSPLRPVTWLLIGGSVAVALLSNFGGNKSLVGQMLLSWSPYQLGNPASFLPEIVQHGQVWRLFSPMLLHFGPMHLIFNMLALADLGGVIERQMGSWRYFVLIVALEIVSALTQYLTSSPNFGGMSGVLFGLFGYAWMQGKFNPAGGLVLTQQTITIMLGFFLLCFTGFVGAIANGAHAGGLILGALIGLVAAFRANADILRRRQEFQRSLVSADEPMHRCHVCGATERTAPDTDFRVASDGEEYCEAHLPSRRPPLPA
ncbi:MAG: rhomboid family intramembrane serine protease [Verrucomicrobia bacterium]|nr:rhomboid family intramembrane serine protease [Verrucomicrobiota bacterium]MBV9659147.1 rhomboid family intramembrane serine protease [Verrucomicrobiota bacterium]